MIIKSKNGRQVGGLSAFPLEQEVLFLPNTNFKVLAVNKEKDGTIQYDLEELTDTK